MEWLDRMNDALGYLEANLAGTADMEHAARLACCSVYHFGRMFSYIAGVPLSEYLRRRRMTLAAFDLQNGGRVLDVALRYGYESPTAFNRAFQSVHGVSPSAAQRDGAPLKAYPRISFKITVKGEAEMDYRIIKQEAFRIVGVREPLLPDFEDSFRRVPEFWGEAAASGAIPRLCLLMDAAPKGILGVSTCMPDAENYYYIAVASTRPAPEGMHEYVVPATPACPARSGSPPPCRSCKSAWFRNGCPARATSGARRRISKCTWTTACPEKAALRFGCPSQSGKSRVRSRETAQLRIDSGRAGNARPFFVRVP